MSIIIRCDCCKKEGGEMFDVSIKLHNYPTPNSCAPAPFTSKDRKFHVCDHCRKNLINFLKFED